MCMCALLPVWDIDGWRSSSHFGPCGDLEDGKHAYTSEKQKELGLFHPPSHYNPPGLPISGLHMSKYLCEDRSV